MCTLAIISKLYVVTFWSDVSESQTPSYVVSRVAQIKLTQHLGMQFKSYNVLKQKTNILK